MQFRRKCGGKKKQPRIITNSFSSSVTCMYINSLYNRLHIPSVIFREDSDPVRTTASLSSVRQSIAGKRRCYQQSSTHRQIQGQEWGARPVKRVLYGLCWLMHSSRPCTLASLTWEVWLWGHHQNNHTSQRLQLALCALWNIRGRMMHYPSNGVHICSFREKPLVLPVGA